MGSFFLLSGFVIFLSLEKTSTLEFLWHRILRVYPVIVAAVAIRLVSQIMMGHRTFDLPTFKLFLLNISLFGNMFIDGGSNIEPIVWSLTLLGAISYPLYAIHTAVIEALMYLNRGSGPSALFLRGIILAVLAAYVMHRLIENPVQRWTKRTSTRRLAPTVEKS